MKKPRTTSSNPAAVFISENDDLLTMILLRLPLKSVAKFKSVSKHWLRLITTTPQFSLPKPLKALFINLFARELLLLDGTAPPVKTTLIPANARYQHSCNGLYLSSRLTLYTSDHLYSIHYQFHVSNPTTKLYTPLPQQYPSPYTDFEVMASYLAFDPSVSSHYKVVAFFDQLYTGIYGVMIYSSETCNWRLSSAPLPSPNLETYVHGVFWNGAIYWTSVEYSLEDKPQLYRFSVFGEEEKMERVALPSSDHVLYLGLSGECLLLIMSAYDDDFDVRGLNMLNTYEMDKGSDQWRHVCCLRDLAGDIWARFDFVKVVPTLCSMGAWPKALERVPCCRVVFFDAEEMCLYLVVEKMLVRYDLKARTFIEIHKGESFNRRTLLSQHVEIIYTAGLTHTEKEAQLNND